MVRHLIAIGVCVLSMSIIAFSEDTPYTVFSEVSSGNGFVRFGAAESTDEASSEPLVTITICQGYFEA